MQLVSVVVPFLNEKDCIVQYCDFVDGFAKDKPFGIEVIFVDDGSTDGTSMTIAGYVFINCPTVKIVKLAKNFGSHAAIRAGIFHSKGDFITYTGADLQEPVEMVTEMYEKMIQGYDAVYAEKKSIGSGFVGRLFSLTYSALMRRFAVRNYGSGGINNIMFNKKIKNYLDSNAESNSSLMLQIIDAGFKSATIPMDYKERSAGKSKWTLAKKTKLFIDSFVAFSFAPIRLVSILGILMLLVGLTIGIVTIVGRLLNPYAPIGFATLASLLAIGFGITNMSLGIIAEYLWRTLDAARKRPVYIVDEIIEVTVSADSRE